MTRATIKIDTFVATVCSATPTSMMSEPMNNVERRPSPSAMYGENGRPLKKRK